MRRHLLLAVVLLQVLLLQASGTQLEGGSNNGAPQSTSASSPTGDASTKPEPKTVEELLQGHMLDKKAWDFILERNGLNNFLFPQETIVLPKRATNKRANSLFDPRLFDDFLASDDYLNIIFKMNLLKQAGAKEWEAKQAMKAMSNFVDGAADYLSSRFDNKDLMIPEDYRDLIRSCIDLDRCFFPRMPLQFQLRILDPSDPETFSVNVVKRNRAIGTNGTNATKATDSNGNGGASKTTSTGVGSSSVFLEKLLRLRKRIQRVAKRPRVAMTADQYRTALLELETKIHTKFKRFLAARTRTGTEQQTQVQALAQEEKVSWGVPSLGGMLNKAKALAVSAKNKISGLVSKMMPTKKEKAEPEPVAVPAPKLLSDTRPLHATPSEYTEYVIRNIKESWVNRNARAPRTDAEADELVTKQPSVYRLRTASGQLGPDSYDMLMNRQPEVKRNQPFEWPKVNSMEVWHEQGVLPQVVPTLKHPNGSVMDPLRLPFPEGKEIKSYSVDELMKEQKKDEEGEQEPQNLAEAHKENQMVEAQRKYIAEQAQHSIAMGQFTAQELTAESLAEFSKMQAEKQKAEDEARKEAKIQQLQKASDITASAQQLSLLLDAQRGKKKKVGEEKS